MNPKAVTSAQMFGKSNGTEWVSGVFSQLWLHACQQVKKVNTWMVLDGPIDPMWIENINTVLDDNRVLTLANSDRIAMPVSMRLLFEVGALSNASPATVSRVGVIYFASNTLGMVAVAFSLV